MPPILPRKRLRGSPPHDNHAQIAENPNPRKARKTDTPSRKATLYDDLDATSTPLSSKQGSSVLKNGNSDESESSLSSLSEDDFEDVPLVKRQKQAAQASEDSEDEDIEFEDVSVPIQPMRQGPVPSGNLELTLERDNHRSLTDIYGDKTGPTKREKNVRQVTHYLHVMTLLWHNAVRNSWLCDREIQAMMLSHLTPRLWEEVDRWRRNSGLEKQTKVTGKPGGTKLDTSRQSSKRKGKGKDDKQKASRSDWGSAARKLEEGEINMSHGDPLFRLMQSLVAWWKQRFNITAPGLRKWGYMPLARLNKLVKAYKLSEEDAVKFGEQIRNREELLTCAERCQGSRDVGAQLFVALLRGLGLDARLVANLQTLGYGFTKLEKADPENLAESQDDAAGTPSSTSKTKSTKGKPQKQKEAVKPDNINNKGTSSRTSRPKSSKRIIPDRSGEDEELDLEYKDTDEESIVELETTPRKNNKNVKKFDQNLEFPIYWVEVLSPVTNKYLPVDPIVKGTIATNRDLIESFEPRGAKADKAHQIIAYIVGYSRDGTAKDVTVRYLKRQMFPGRTKSTRTPLIKIPVYNKYGKVKRHEMFDWFKTAMSGYRRGTKLHPFTETDDLEDVTDLKPAKPEKKEVKDGEETLQYYKQSQEFVLQRHLKREEALKPNAQPVKVFKAKVKGGKIEEEDVYLREDVVKVKSQETWHKQGRAPLPGEHPLKQVPYRAATTNRRRELMEAEIATGGKVLQGLFSWDQTDWIIPAPIKDGIIPKNEYGNIDLFAEHMCPAGAVHVPFRGAIKVCKRLGYDYAEAVVDFEFGHRMAVPVIQGIVVAEEYHDRVMEELEKDEAERVRKEDEKRRKVAVSQWRKFLMGMRIVEQIRKEYGDYDDTVSVFSHNKTAPSRLQDAPAQDDADEDMGGGFLPEGFVEEGAEESAYQTSSFFPVGGDDDDDDDDGGLIMEDGQTESKEQNQAAQQGLDDDEVNENDDESELSEAPSDPPQLKAKAKRKAPARIAKGKAAQHKKHVISDSEDDNEGSDDDYEYS